MASKGIMRRIGIWHRVLMAYLRTFRGVACNICDADATVDEIMKGKSLIRFGDGEFGIYQGHDIHYQPWSEELRAEFIAIKSEFESGSCPYLLAVPKKYMQCSGLDLGRKRVLVSSWSESRLFFKKKFNLRLRYGDSFLFEKKNKEIYSRIWTQAGDARKIVFVHNDRRYADFFSTTYNREVIFVKCLPYDAFGSVDSLKSEILSVINGNNLSSGDVQVVLSAGPAGKVLVRVLSNYGYQCIDAGHCWDDPLET